MRIKTYKFFFFLIATIFIIPIVAIEKDPCTPKDVCCEQPALGPFAFSYPKDVGLSCPRDFYLHSEFLWMKPSEEGLEYAIDQDSSPSNQFPLTNGMVKGFSRESDEWDWRPGFRVGFGCYAMHDTWNFQADWTYIKIKSDSEVNNRRTGSLLSLFIPPDLGVLDPLNTPNASARWSGDFNTLDLMIGKPYHVSRYYISNPMFGIRAGWIDQDYHIRHFTADVSSPLVFHKDNIFLKNDYWGVGLRGFYEGQFLLGHGFSFWGKMAFSLLFGKFDMTQHSGLNPEYDRVLEYYTEDSFYSVQPNAELGLGFDWSNFFHKNQYKISLKVGYEFHHWWDQNQARRFFDNDPTANDTLSRGDLSFNGFMFGFNLEF